MKKGRIIRSLLALVMIFQITSCGAATESADAMVMNKTAPAEAEAVRTTAATAYYDGKLADDAEFGTAAGSVTYSYTADSASGSSAPSGTAGVNDKK